jgi:hypothetical protein
MERAVRENRVLITEDKDFGQLVYAKMQKTAALKAGPGSGQRNPLIKR